MYMKPVTARFAGITRQHVAGALASIVFVAGCGGNDSNSNTPGLDTTNFPALALLRVFPELNFDAPVGMLQAPGDTTRWFVLQRGSASMNGKVIVFPNNDAADPEQKSEFVSISVDTTGEGGLLGMAFHPDFPTIPNVFLSYTRTGPDVDHPLTTVISRFTSTDGGLTLDPDTEEEIITLDQPFTNHNGGHIAFGPDGMLYLGLGDGGSGNDPLNNGQNVANIFGAILRIDVDDTAAAGKNYAIPPDNPFAGGGGAPEIYAWGLRNPWRWSFDLSTNKLWLGDVGQGRWEEIDVIEIGKNYGWSTCEGAHRRGTTTPCSVSTFVDPITEYGHGQGCSVTGGFVYRGSNIAGLDGMYFFGDFCSGTVWALRQVPSSPVQVGAVINTGFSVVSFAQSPDGEIYIVNIGGTLHKIVGAP